ncbi:MAG: hypothetical protein MJE12_01675 [Alphaproteobacteria bacterium]|nr:hypothetical protein [Alphaproteobacteria bacterium]
MQFPKLEGVRPSVEKYSRFDGSPRNYVFEFRLGQNPSLRSMLKSVSPKTVKAIWAIVGLVSIANTGIAFAGPDTGHFRHLQWKGGAYFSKTKGVFSHCAVTAVYQSRTVLGFAYFDSGLSLILGNRKWHLDEKEIYEVTLSIDDIWTLKVKAFPRKARSEKAFIVDIHIGRSQRALRSLRNGHVLKVTTASDQLRYRLTGTNVALQKLVRCHRAYSTKSAVTSSTNPFAAKSATRRFKPTNPFSVPLSKKSRTGLPGAEKTKTNPEFVQVAKWAARVGPITDKFYRVINSLGDAEDVAIAFLNGKVTEEYANERTIKLVYQAQSVLSLADDNLEALPDAPKFSHYPNLGRDTKRFLGQLRDQVHSMLADTKKSVAAALSDDRQSHTTLMLKGFTKTMLLLKTENFHLDLQNSHLTSKSPQYYLNDAIKYGNESMIQVLLARITSSNKETLFEMESADRKIVSSLTNLARAIEKGRNLVSRSRQQLDAGLTRNSRLRKQVFEVMQLYEEAFDVEQEIALAISSIAEIIGDILSGPADDQNREMLSKRLDVAALEMEQYGERRTALARRRVEIIEAIGLH